MYFGIYLHAACYGSWADDQRYFTSIFFATLSRNTDISVVRTALIARSTTSSFVCPSQSSTATWKRIGPSIIILTSVDMPSGNLDIALLQPIYQHDARETLAKLYGGWMDRKIFCKFMDEIVYSKDLPGSTAQDPKLEVRTLIINDFLNTTDPGIKFKWLMSEDPGKFKLCHPAYWKETEDVFGGGKKPTSNIDPVEELEQANCLMIHNR